MREELLEYVRGIRIRDCILIVVCALSVYLLRARDMFELQPIWRKHINERTAYENGRYPTSRERLPRPVLTDLDNDGVVEVVLVSGDLELQVCSVPHGGVGGLRRLPDLVVRDSVELVADRGESGSHRPVILETGYLVPAVTELQHRTQVIVVMFDDWTIHCYDEHLRLLWTQVLLDVNHPHRRYDVRAAGVLITPHVLHAGDNGTVIVGASFVHTEHNLQSKVHVVKENVDELIVNAFDDADGDSSVIDEKLTHFSAFALSGTDGRIWWHHLPGDFEPDHLPVSEPFHWKLGLKRGRWHVGEVHWSKYAANLLSHLPHHWRDMKDTRFDLADLRRSDIVSSGIRVTENLEPTLAPLSDIIGLEHEHVVGQAYGGMRPHSRHEHVKWPNAVIIHHDTGIQVLSFTTGRPLTNLPLLGRNVASVFIDLNGDNQVEEVRPDFALKCAADVSSVHPRPRALFGGPLCESPFWWGGVSIANLFQSTDVVNEDTHVAVSPAVVPRVAHSRGVLNHLLGRNLPSVQSGFDSIFLTSTGRLTSYSPTGEPNWQNVLPTSWSHIALQSELSSSFAFTDSGKVYMDAFRPSLKPLSLQLFGKKTAVLVSGWDTIVLIDLRDGYIIGQHSLPCQPLDEPVIGDFNNDGWSDFVVVCPDGFIGFEFQKGSKVTYTVTVAVTVVLVILLLLWCCIRQDGDEGWSEQNLNDRSFR